MSPDSLLQVKSKFGAEYRRISIDPSRFTDFQKFYKLLEEVHHLQNIPFVIQYIVPESDHILPINNDDNFAVALVKCKHILRIWLQRKGESYGELYGYTGTKHRIHRSGANVLRSIGNKDKKQSGFSIQLKDDFQLVSSIIDVKILPREMRRVRLVQMPNKQFGLYIRDGISSRLTENGYETVPAFFISRLDKDGIAYSTGLLAENDEIIEVNGIEVFGKTMDQVTDMMVANSSNLIITVRPSNQDASLPYTSHNHHPLSTYASLPAVYHNSRDQTRPISRSDATNERSRPHAFANTPRVYSSDVHYNSSIGIAADEDEDTDEDITAGLITL